MACPASACVGHRGLVGLFIIVLVYIICLARAVAAVLCSVLEIPLME